MTWLDAIKFGLSLTLPILAYVVVSQTLRAVFDYFLKKGTK